jgi:hypothetical protein
MAKNHAGSFPPRRLALAGCVLGAAVLAGSGAFGQLASGAWVPTAPPDRTLSDLAAAGVVVPGSPLSASEADQPEAPPAEAATPLPRGAVDASGVVGAAPANIAPTPSDPAAAGVITR